MKKLDILDKVPEGFAGELEIFTRKNKKIKDLPQTRQLFALVKIEKPLNLELPVYLFLFDAMKDNFKEQPELKMDKFQEVFEAAMAVNGVEETEKEISDLFGKQFSFKLI